MSFALFLTPHCLTSSPFSFFFFGGLGIHLSQALIAHLISYNITWGATKKEVERSNFWLEVPKILRRFWLALIISFIIAVAMVVLSTSAVPIGWRILSWDWAVIFPLAITLGSHVLYPVSCPFVYTVVVSGLTSCFLYRSYSTRG
jgi:hypothetical protein